MTGKVIKSRITLKYVLILLAVALFFTLSCSGVNRPQTGKPQVITTTNLIADIVKRVGGEFVQVRALISAGVDPHQYKASEGDVIRIADADIIFHNGLKLEGKLEDVLRRAQNVIPSFPVSHDIPENLLIRASNGEYDPHIWFDPALWVYAVQTVADALVALDPDNTFYYRKNEEIYVEEILNMDKKAREMLAAVPQNNRILVTSHNAFAYFGRSYGWNVIGVQGVSTVGEISIYSIHALARELVESNVRCIFPETTVSGRFIEALQASSEILGRKFIIGEVLFSDSIGNDTENDTYITMFLSNVENIIAGVNQGDQR
jgi:manganese/zinc/iron transport system substrate-binding protein